MNRRLISLIAAPALLVAVAGQAQASLQYNPVVTLIGDGTSILGAKGYNTAIAIYNNSTAGQTSPISSASYLSASTDTSRLVTAALTQNEGKLSNNPGLADAAAAGTVYTGTGYVYNAGYNAANATANINTSSANAPRVVGYANVTNFTVTAPTILAQQPYATAYAGVQITSATGDNSASVAYSGGAFTSNGSLYGAAKFNSPTQQFGPSFAYASSSAVELLGGNLWSTSNLGTPGLSIINTSTGAATLVIGTGASGAPTEYALFRLGTGTASNGYDTAYISTGTGLRKYTFDGSAWALAYTFARPSNGTGGFFGIDGLAGELDPSTGLVTLYATTSDGLQLGKYTDTGSGATFSQLAVAPTNYRFRGVALSIPTPSAAALLGLSGLVATRRRRA